MEPDVHPEDRPEGIPQGEGGDGPAPTPNGSLQGQTLQLPPGVGYLIVVLNPDFTVQVMVAGLASTQTLGYGMAQLAIDAIRKSVEESKSKIVTPGPRPGPGSPGWRMPPGMGRR